jgi:hypothetical protein
MTFTNIAIVSHVSQQKNPKFERFSGASVERLDTRLGETDSAWISDYWQGKSEIGKKRT